MFIAMNRFRVAKGSEAAFEQVWMSRDSHLEKVPGFVEFHLLKGPEAEDHTLYACTLFGRTVLCLKLGPNQKRSGPRITRPAITSRCISISHSSRGSRFARRSGAASLRWYNTHSLESVRELRQCPLSEVTRKTFAHNEFFSG
jgi:Antibiotic biosynthesis monooxygenase